MKDEQIFQKYQREKEKRKNLEKVVAWQQIELEETRQAIIENRYYLAYIKTHLQPVALPKKKRCPVCGNELDPFKRKDAVYCGKKCKKRQNYLDLSAKKNP